jgi:hypothetical protein
MSLALSVLRAEKDVVNAAKADVKEALSVVAIVVPSERQIALKPSAKLQAMPKHLPMIKLAIQMRATKPTTPHQSVANDVHVIVTAVIAENATQEAKNKLQKKRATKLRIPKSRLKLLPTHPRHLQRAPTLNEPMHQPPTRPTLICLQRPMTTHKLRHRSQLLT